jgi:hypothetical protein
VAVDPALTAEALILVKAQAASREQIAAATSASAAAAVRAMLAGGWYDAGAITRLVKQLAATTRAGQRQMQTSTAAYWARISSLTTGRRVPPAPLVDTTLVRGLPLESVYGRLADQYRWLAASRGPGATTQQRLEHAVTGHWRKLARQVSTVDHPDLGVVPDGEAVTAKILDEIRDAPLSAAELAKRLDEIVALSPAPVEPPTELSLDEILTRVADRVELMVDESLTMALRAQIEAAAKKDPGSVTGYRRVLHPELSRGGSCGLCVACSTRVYKSGNMLPFHARCRCEVLPIVTLPGGEVLDVGDGINAADLSSLYNAAGGTTSGAALKETRWRVVRSGETGARLVDGGPDGGSVWLEPARTYQGSRRGSEAKSAASTPAGATRGSVDPGVVAEVAQRQVAELQARVAAGDESARGPLEFQRGLLERMRTAA